VFYFSTCFNFDSRHSTRTAEYPRPLRFQVTGCVMDGEGSSAFGVCVDGPGAAQLLYLENDTSLNLVTYGVLLNQVG
jgi:hypothetical protein